MGVSRLMVPGFLLLKPSVAEAAQALGERIVAPCAQVQPTAR